MDAKGSSGDARNGNGLSRAERFEDEKQRIVESCFGKKDTDGSLLESYITHIRIIEDAQYPSSPPPPNASTDTKKPRLIIVAVRKSGRVRMHKARENVNGTFSIGKTWMLDDLSAVQSYTGTTPKTAEEAQAQQWAGGIGFTVTIGKPYYWQANTPKEKQFFIASLVKIYTKYTGGRSPELIGFDPREQEQMLGTPPSQARPTTATQVSGPPSGPPLGQPAPPFASQGHGRNSSGNRSRAPSQEPRLRKQSSREQMQRPTGGPPGQLPSSSLPPPLSSQTSRSQVRPRRDESPGSNGLETNDAAPQQSQGNLRKFASQNQSQEPFNRSTSQDDYGPPPRSRNGPNAGGMASMTDRRRKEGSSTPNSTHTMTPESGIPAGQESAPDVPRVPSPLTLPTDRRRPPIPALSPVRKMTMDENSVAPLSPGPRRDGMRPPTRSGDRPPTRGSERPLTRGNDRPPIQNGEQPFQPNNIFSNSIDNGIDSIVAPASETRRPSVVAPPAIPEPRRPSIVASPRASEPGRPSIVVPTVVPSAQFTDSPTDTSRGSIPPPSPVATAPAALSSSTPVTSPTLTSPTNTMSPPSEDPMSPEEQERPGLGPMIKKKASKGVIANKLFMAANAASAFKPRAGGAAERLRALAAQAKEAGPDGITGVVPAPSLLRGLSSDNTKVAPLELGKKEELKKDELPPPSPMTEVPEVKVTMSETDRPKSDISEKSSISLGATPEKSKPREAKRAKPTSEMTKKHLETLGVDPGILDGRGTEFASILDDFGWNDAGVHTKSIDQLKEDIDRELNKAQAGSWLNRLEEEDDRVEAIKMGLDHAITECEELDGLLTLYSVELGTLNEDIAYIEAQSQGLQVQTANQKLLQAELESLLQTISISSTQLQSLREASLESPRGLAQIEASLMMLFKAMVTIDPTLSDSAPRKSEDGSSIRSGRGPGIANSEIGNMRVLQEKKDVYRSESVLFLRRLKVFLQIKFAAAIDETRKALEQERQGSLTRRPGKVKLDPRNHDLAHNVLWRYSALMLFSREVDRIEWEEFMRSYETMAKPLYKEEYADFVLPWKRMARETSGDESELLFTSQIEKQAESLAAGVGRKLTVKRSGTLGKSLRSTPSLGDVGSKMSVDKTQSGKLYRYEVFGGILEEIIPIISMEQNFVVEFFHVSSLELVDFPDIVMASLPEERRGGDLRRPKIMDPDRSMARRVYQTMEEIFSFLPGELEDLLVKWALTVDPLQGIGILAALERKMLELSESNQEFLARTLQKVHAKLLTMFGRFLDDQIRAIEDTKVKIKKRKGVIAFMRIFPSFSAFIESMLMSAEDLDVRETVNNAYVRINKTMFESLKVIARDNPTVQPGQTTGDPEDKEALNYQILLIENMNHYLEEVESRHNPVLEEWQNNAQQELEEHMDLYLYAVIRRPLGKLLDFLESSESLLKNLQPGQPPSTIAQRASHSRTTFKKLLSTYDSKEIRKGIENLKKRVEKHFGDADDPGLSRDLVAKVLRSCESYYDAVEDRVVRISRDVYDGDVVVEWTKADVSQAFRK